MVIALAQRQMVPGKTVLEGWLREGLTHQQIADRIKAELNEDVTRSAVTAAIQRHGLTTRTVNRYDETLPWRIVPAHAMDYAARMLRLLGRKMSGGTLNHLEAKRLT
jgi:hypothetical protein